MSILIALLIAAWPLGETSGAQAPQQPGPGELVTVSGCVAQPSRTGSLLSDTAGATPAPATPNTAGIEANSNEPVNAFVLLDATPYKKDPGGASHNTRTSYALQGREAELAVHRGHRVEIVGVLVLPPASSSAGQTPQRILVKSMKVLESQCSAAASSRPRKAQ